MRTAYVCADPGVPVFGTKGSSVHVQEIVREMLARGSVVHIFATRFDGVAPPDLAPAITHWLSALPKGNMAARERASLGANRGLRAMLHGAGTFDMVYERYSLWSYAGMEYAREKGIPGILEVNAPLIEEQSRFRGLVDRETAERVAHRAFDAASAILVVSREIAGYLERFAVTSGKVHVVPNGVNAERFHPHVPPLLPRDPRSFVVGFVGTLKPWHGLSSLASAFGELRRRYPECRLVVGGDGPERETLASALESEGALEATTLVGSVSPADVPGLLTSLDAAVAPYPAVDDFYFSPLKIYEYMAAGLPVVASAIGQIPEIITHGVTGLLCPPGDSACFAQALAELHESPELRQRLGGSARESILREHTWKRVADRIMTLAPPREQARARKAAG